MLPFAIHAAELRVATAANFYLTLNKIKQLYEEKTGHKIVIIRGSTGKLYAQIIRGAPYDLFFSADSARADRLVSKGKSADNISEVYAVGQLVLWRPDVNSSQQLRKILVSGNFKKLAIANPKTAPYGKASIEALKSLELYEAVKNKLVYGENISQVVQFVQSGAADIGLVSRSYVNHDIYWEVAPYLHQPINQKMLILKQTKQPLLAKDFFNFLHSNAVRKIIEGDGYQL